MERHPLFVGGQYRRPTPRPVQVRTVSIQVPRRAYLAFAASLALLTAASAASVQIAASVLT